jgi:Cys-rich protein (TIGR01571 family)
MAPDFDSYASIFAFLAGRTSRLLQNLHNSVHSRLQMSQGYAVSHSQVDKGPAPPQYAETLGSIEAAPTGPPTYHDVIMRTEPSRPAESQNEDTRKSKWRYIMETGICDCCDDEETCLMSCVCPCIMFGSTYALSKQGPFCIGLLAWPLLCGVSRSHIQKVLGVGVQSCPCTCLTHVCLPCCAISQEARAVRAWSVAGCPPAAAAAPAPLEMGAAAPTV